MKRLIIVLLFLLFAMPLVGSAEEPFVFRDRYTWGMSTKEVKELATEEGLSLKYGDESYLSYQNVPVAGITAEELVFRMGDDGLGKILYTMTFDHKKALDWWPHLLEQLTLIYGEHNEAESQQFMLDYKCSNAFVWSMPTTFIALVGQDSDNSCRLAYLRKAPPPAPTPLVFTTDGL